MKEVEKMASKDKFQEIDKMFDELQKANDETVDSLKNKLSSDQDLLSFKNTAGKKAAYLKRPSLPRLVPKTVKTRLDIFLYCMKNVDYGEDNVRSYVDGHLAALNKYLEQASFNQTNLEVVYGTLYDELKKMQKASKDDLYDKGYADGLSYVDQALRRSKDVMAKNINDILKKELADE